MAPLMFHESTMMFNEYMMPDLSLDMNTLFDDHISTNLSMADANKKPVISGGDSTVISPQGSSSSSSYYSGGVIRNKVPFKRRSRACKKGPTTLLKANAKDFRALVQRFTGRSRAGDRTFKGPINLNFSKYNRRPEKSQKQRSRIHDSHDEGSDQSFFSFACENSVSAAAAITINRPCVVSSVVHSGNPKPDQLSSLDDLTDMENFFIPDFSDLEDCSDLVVDNDLLWGC